MSSCSDCENCFGEWKQESEAFRYANLIKVYNQCRRKKKQKSSEEDK